MRNFTNLILAVLAVGLYACERDDSIRTYQAPREVAAQSPTTAPWTAPAGWVQDPPRQMRVATFRTSSEPDAAELIITRFAADNFGGMVDNINRWRNMVGLEPVKDESEQPVEKIAVSGREASVYDMTGPARDSAPSRRLRLAMVKVGTEVWFVRFTGTADAVQKNLPGFDEFLKSVRFEN